MRTRPLWALSLLLLAACGDGPSQPSITLSIDPHTVPPLLVGDDVTLTATLSAPGPSVTWTSSSPSVAAVSGGFVLALRPGRAWIVASGGGAADSLSVTVIPRPGGYAAAEIDYFLEIAFGFEFGAASEIVRKWPGDIRVRVNGNPNQQDRVTLEGVLAEINELTFAADMLLVDDEPMVEVYFEPESQFLSILSSWVPGNVGYFSVWWDGSQHFTRAVVLISTDIDQVLRDHIIREEVTQTLGLAQDSHQYPESIFYQGFSTVSQYAEVDRALIEILYRPEVMAGMDRSEAGLVVRRLVRGGASTVLGPVPTAERARTGLPGSGSGSNSGRLP